MITTTETAELSEQKMSENSVKKYVRVSTFTKMCKTSAMYVQKPTTNLRIEE